MWRGGLVSSVVFELQRAESGVEYLFGVDDFPYFLPYFYFLHFISSFWLRLDLNYSSLIHTS